MKLIYSLGLIIGLFMTLLATSSVAFADDCASGANNQCHGKNKIKVASPETDVPEEADESEGEVDDSGEATIAASDQFVVNEPPEDTLFGRRWYGRLADNANVYAAPSLSAPIVRNVFDGYLFSTVNSWAENDVGETWYEINYQEYVQAKDINIVEVSEFRGVEITSQPERPFGWVVVRDVYPSTEPGGEPDESQEPLIRYEFIEVYDSVQEGDWLWYDVGGGRWLQQTNFSIVDVDPRPEEVGEDEFWVEVDVYEQTFAAYEGDQMVYATLVSTGLNRWPTYEGIYQVEPDQRFKEYKMSGAEGLKDYYFLEDVPYIMYFDMLNGIALHGTYWHDRFGYKQSHGCVNMTIIDAEWTFNWSAEAPNDLWVSVQDSGPETASEE